MRALSRIKLWSVGLVAVGALVALLAPVPAWACQCLEPPCSTTPCHTCTQCIFASGCYSQGAKITQGPCSIYCNMPDCGHTCTWWSDCIP